MAIDVHVLGTASARPTGRRAVSGSLVKTPNGIAVIDAGEGFQTRFARQRHHLKHHAQGVTLKPSAVNVLAFTHGHLDHTWGALPWLQSMDLQGRQTPLLVIGPTSCEALDALEAGEPLPDAVPPVDLARQWAAWWTLAGQGFGFEIRWVLGDPATNRWVELNPSSGEVRLLEAMPQPEGWTSCAIHALPTDHSVPSCGWLIDQAPKPGAFDRARADELGLNTKQRARLARGEDIQGPEGQLESSWFRGESGPPLSVLISGDTAPTPKAWKANLAPTLLIHEATYLELQADKAEEHLHSTASGAVRTAHHIKAKHLALTHYSSRIASSSEPLGQAAALAGPLPVVALNDGDRLLVSDQGEVNHLRRTGEGWSSASMAPNR